MGSEVVTVRAFAWREVWRVDRPVANVTQGSVPRLPLTGLRAGTFVRHTRSRRHRRIGSVMSSHNSSTMNTSNTAMTGIATAAIARGSTV